MIHCHSAIQRVKSFQLPTLEKELRESITKKKRSRPIPRLCANLVPGPALCLTLLARPLQKTPTRKRISRLIQLSISIHQTLWASLRLTKRISLLGNQTCRFLYPSMLIWYLLCLLILCRISKLNPMLDLTQTSSETYNVQHTLLFAQGETRASSQYNSNPILLWKR